MNLRPFQSLFVAAVTLMACATQPPIPVGKAVIAYMEIGEKKIPLPPGEWTVTRSKSSSLDSFYPGTNTLPTASVTLRNSPASPYMVVVATNTASAVGQGFVESRHCQRKDWLFLKMTINEQVGDQECWWVDRRVVGRNTSRPVPIIVVGYRLADINDFLNVTYIFRPNKTDFVDAKEWGRAWSYRVKAGFKGEFLRISD